MNTKMNKDREATMDDVLEMISGFETGNFSNTLTAPDDSKLKPLVDKLNSTAKILAAQNAQNVAFIIDSGSALPETVAQKMMNPFFTTKEVGKGTGLGLSISMGIIKTHGGDLAYNQSAPNTTFTIDLPGA